jgi:hypothetical protein
MDRQGRVLVPPQLRRWASLDGEVVVVGIGDGIEVWDTEAFDQLKAVEESGWRLWTRNDGDDAEAITHEPVMLREVLAGLNVQPGGRYVDCTVNGGGHAEAILEMASPGGSLVGPTPTRRPWIAPASGSPGSRVPWRWSRRTSAMSTGLPRKGFAPVNGILFDLGLSSHQLGAASRLQLPARRSP